MKIAILSRNTKLYSTARLVEAARSRGHRVRVLDPLRCYMRIAPGDFSVHYKGRALADYDAVIPRVGASITFSSAVMCGNKLNCWNTIPISARLAHISLSRSS